MSDPANTKEHAAKIESKALRKLQAQKEGRQSILFGLGMFGLIGWAVAVPALVGIALGIWLDKITSSDFSWTLALLVAGVFIGCWNAWYWVNHESQDHKTRNGDRP